MSLSLVGLRKEQGVYLQETQDATHTHTNIIAHVYLTSRKHAEGKKSSEGFTFFS